MSGARGLSFLILGGLCASSAAVAADAPPPLIPHCKFVAAGAFFPMAAERLGLYGVVTVSFGIDSQGRIDHPVVVASDSKYFTETTLRLLRSATCEVPPQSQDNGSGNRYTVDLQYLLPPCEKLPKSAQAERVLFYVCGSLIPGAHPRRAHSD